MDEDRWGKMLSALRYVSPKDWGYVVPFVEDVLSEKYEAERARADRLAAALDRLSKATQAEKVTCHICGTFITRSAGVDQALLVAAAALADSPKEVNDGARNE